MGKEREEAIKNNMLALIVEATEVLNEVNWKPWKKVRTSIDEHNLKEEIVDCLLFVYNAAYEAGMSPKQLADGCYIKQNKNIERFK